MSIREKIIDYSRGNDLSRFWRLYRRQQRAKSGFRRDVLTFLMSRCAARHGGYVGPDAVIRGVPSLPHGLHGVFTLVVIILTLVLAINWRDPNRTIIE